jgi:hypothetical protein
VSISGSNPQANQVSTCWLFLCLLFPHLICLFNKHILKSFTALNSNGGHTPPIENQFCMLRGVENGFSLGVIKSLAGACSLALSKERARQSSFFCAFCLRYSVCPSGLHRSVKKSKCKLHLLNVEILVARLSGISYGGGVQVPYEETRPTRRFFCA